MAENKQLLTRNRKGTAHLEVYFEGGGEVPQELSGLFTSKGSASKAIEHYLVNRKKKPANGSDSSK